MNLFLWSSFLVLFIVWGYFTALDFYSEKCPLTGNAAVLPAVGQAEQRFWYRTRLCSVWFLRAEDGGGGRDAESDRWEAPGLGAGPRGGLGGVEPRGGGLSVPRDDRTQARG